MNRYKVYEKDFAAAKKFLSGKGFRKDSPSWAVKHKDKLSFKGGKLFFDNKEIVPVEKVESYLRDMLYSAKERVPMSRDAAFHLLKKRIGGGISRRTLMNFISGQNVNESGRAAVPKVKTGGKPIKNYTIEFDLVFIRRNDLEKMNKRFKQADREDIPFESYIISVCEKSTGMCVLGYTKRKLSHIVTPKLLKLMKRLCKRLGVNPKDVSTQSDRGGEFGFADIKKVFKDWNPVSMGPSIEAKNRHIQKQMYNALKARKTVDLQKAIQIAEETVNETYSRITKKTPNESVEDDEKTTVGKYNKERKKGEDGRVLKTGDLVRIVIKKPKAGIEFKSYKGNTVSKAVYRITKQTKNVPKKFRVNGRYYLSQQLLKTTAVDTKSEKLIEERDTQQREKDDVEHKKHLAEMKKRLEEMVAKKKTEKNRSGRPLRSSARASREKAIQAKIEDERLRKLLGE
jgi:hypothetical protein